MPVFHVNPIPEMVSQRFSFLPSFIPIIDPTCGRYCLKSLLKYWYEVTTGARLTDVTLPKPASRLADWIGFDPVDDFPHGKALLAESSNIPQTPEAWIALLRRTGPIILAGRLGQATFVGHYILLVGMSSDGPAKFHYKDPLAGDGVQSEAFATMQARIETPLVFARADITTKIAVFRPPEILAMGQ
jgi:hypothetical protein